MRINRGDIQCAYFCNIIVTKKITTVITGLFLLSAMEEENMTAEIIGIKPNTLKVEVDNNGNYRLHVANETWLEGAPPFFYADGIRCSIDDGTLEVVIVMNYTSSDYDGFFANYGNKITYTCNETFILADIKVYYWRNIVKFTVKYVNGTNNTQANGERETTSGFPGFKMDSDFLPLGFLTYSDKQISNVHTGRWNSSAVIPDGLEGSGPVALFDQTGRCLVASQADNFMVSSNWQDKINNRLYWGIMGSIDEIPANFTYTTAIVFQTGIKKAIGVWGSYLRTLATHSFLPSKMSDYSKQYLGYWTSKGSAYYDGPETGKTYEQTIKDVKNQLTKSPYPNIRYVQLDDWWHIKDSDNRIKNWSPSPTNLPHGLQKLAIDTRFKFMAYAGVWSPDNVYLNNSKYQFLVENGIALPTDQQFWSDLFKTARSWGITTFQQGKMGETFLSMNSTKTELYLARDWLQQMADAATTNNINIIYNDAYSRHILQSLYTKSVTQVRVGNGVGAWKIGAQSLFLSALRLNPSIGVFSSKSVDPELLEVVAILSGGSVGFGDAIGSADNKKISRCCDNAGNVLRPDKIALPINLQIIEQAFHNGSGPVGEIWSTHSSLINADGGVLYSSFDYGIIFVNELNGPYTIQPSYINIWKKSKIYRLDEEPLIFRDFDEDNPAVIQGCNTTFCLYHTAPVINHTSGEYVIIGDLTKWIPATSRRITKINVRDRISIEVSAASGEIVPISYLVNNKLKTVNVPTDEDGHGAWIIYDPPTTSGLSTPTPKPVGSAITLSLSRYVLCIVFAYTLVCNV